MLDAFLWRCEHSRAVRSRDSNVALPIVLEGNEELVDAVARTLRSAPDSRWDATCRGQLDSSSANAFATFRFDALQIFYPFASEGHDTRASRRGFAARIEEFLSSRPESSPSLLGVVVTVVLVPLMTQAQVAHATAASGDAVKDMTPRSQWKGIGDNSTADDVRRVLRGCAAEFVGQPVPVSSISDLVPFHRGLTGVQPGEAMVATRRAPARWRVDGVDGCKLAIAASNGLGPMDLSKILVMRPDGSSAVVEWHALRRISRDALVSTPNTKRCRDEC